MRSRSICLILLVCLGATAQAGTIHRWVDENGRVHFGQTPPATAGIDVQTTAPRQRPTVDPVCCTDAGRLGGEVANAFTRGYKLVDVHQMFPPSRHPQIVEIANFVSDKSRLGYPPQRIAGMTETACLNGSLLACRGEAGIDSGAPSGPATGKASYGTGFHVNARLIVTNNHVVVGCSRISIGEGDIPVELLARDTARDLALLRASQPGAGVVSLRGDDQLELGESLLVAGYPLRHILGSLNITTGNVSALSGAAGNQSLFQISAPIQPGSSGGPVLDRYGQLIGVVVSKLNDNYGLAASGSVPQNVNFAIQLRELKAFLGQQGVDYQQSRLSDISEHAATSRAAQDYTVAIRCQG